MSCLRRLLIITLSLAAMPSGWSKDLPVIQIRVLGAESHQFLAPALAPANCDYHDISAYCSNSRPTTYVENTMVVEEPNGNSLEIACTVYNRWSHCRNLPVNQSFQARIGKRGLEIRYLDQHGKMRKQAYEIVREDGKEAS